MTSPSALQIQPLSPVPSGVQSISVDGMVSHTWDKWFIDLRVKLNTINEALATWSGVTPVTGVSPGTYGDATHYPVVIVNQYGQITGASEEPITSSSPEGLVWAEFSNPSGPLTVASSIPVTIPYGWTITLWRITSDGSSGSVTFDILKKTSQSASGVSIVGGSPPSMPSGSYASGSPTGWTTTGSADELLYFTMTAVSVLTGVRIELVVTKS